MLSLQKHHITDLFVMVDDLLPTIPKPLGGRPSKMCDSELITILLWNAMTVQSKTLKGIYQYLTMYHQADFPQRPSYQAFVEHSHRAIPLLIILLKNLLAEDSPVRFMDSTMLPVCKLVRAETHKVAQAVARWGKNHQGWHYGFKLHASVNPQGQLCGLVITPADVYDAQMMPKILNQQTKIAVGDGGYTARVMREFIWEKYGTLVVAPPHCKQKKKLITWWQLLLLRLRPKIETTFDYLKEHLNLVTSFPRSIMGYLGHYLRVTLAYQLLNLGVS
jgi:hypothetical protein